MRALWLIIAVLAALGGCMQEADYVATSPALNEAGAGGTGGTGGAGGTAGTSGIGDSGGAGGAGGSGGSSENCDPLVSDAYWAFSEIDEVECQYATDDAELESLLIELVYTQPAPELTQQQAEEHPDPLCSIISEALREPLRWRYALDDGNTMQENQAVKVICPRYCVAMQAWLAEHRDLARQCSR